MIIRNATINDAPFIALVVVEALGDDIMERYPDSISDQDRRKLALIADSICREGTLYSWRHTLIAEGQDGHPIGAIVSYEGEGYLEMRRRTFAMLGELITFDVESMDAEARPGEYYLDSLSVLPEYRGNGVGRLLIQSAVSMARSLFLPATLACEPNNLGAKDLYESLGFRHDGDLFIFGHHYLRMLAE